MNLDQISSYLQSLDQKTKMRIGIAVTVILIIVIMLTTVNKQISSLEQKRVARESDLIEIMKLKTRYLEAREVNQRLSNRLLATRVDDSPAKIIEEIAIKGRSSQIKPIKGEEIAGFIEDAAEIKIEGLTANELTNLIYKLEKGVRPITIKKATIKQRFDDQAKLDISLTIALIKSAPSGSK